MALAQPAASPAGDDDINSWMAQRWRDVQSLGGQAEAAGRNLWAQATRTGLNLNAPNPGDIPAIGAQFLKVSNRSVGAPNASAAVPQFVPTPDAPTPDALRQRQAWFKQTQLDPLDKQNSWMAAIALAPAALLGLDLPAAFGVGNAADPVLGITDFPELEAWQAQIERQLGRALTKNEKDALREIGRERWAQANGVSAKEFGAQVHHEDPLEWAHLKPNADPNRFSNLVGLRPPGHALANRAWDLFRRSLGGAQPSPAQVMAQKLRINPLLEPYVVRPGLPQPPPKPPLGGAL
jgi:hypothetical protein